MINFATVHWKSTRWIDVQLRYLERHVHAPYRVWAFLGKIPAENAQRFHYASLLPIRRHEWKLNLLGDLICQGARDPDELIVFIDGDAFPIQPLVPYVREQLAGAPLVAVQRRENDGDRQPHPLFCATTVGFWREIGGDWGRGGTWTNAKGESVTDVGGNLLANLEAREIRWQPMLRSNVRNPHPLMFGVYDDIVYHHGAGFRRDLGGRVALAARTARMEELDSTVLARLSDRLPKRGVFRALRRRHHPRLRYRRRLLDAVTDTSEQIFAALSRDESFHRAFTDPDYEGDLAEITAPLVLD